MSHKRKKIKFEYFMAKLFPHYRVKSKRNIKDIQNNVKHKPKGQR